MDEQPDSVTCEEPRILDTYALVYAFVLLFLVPSVLLLSRLPFGASRSTTYSFSYVSLVTVPFVLGLVATFLSDNRDGLVRAAKRAAVLVPIVIMTGVAVLFTSALFVVPVSGFIVPENFGWLTWVSMALLGLLASPLVMALWRRIRSHTRPAELVQAVVLALALVLIAGVLYGSSQGMLGRDLVRKDLTIYIVGAVTWYLPAFGIAAGVWRRVGLV